MQVEEGFNWPGGYRSVSGVLLPSGHRDKAGWHITARRGHGVTSTGTGSSLQPHHCNPQRHPWKITACSSEGVLAPHPSSSAVSYPSAAPHVSPLLCAVPVPHPLPSSLPLSPTECHHGWGQHLCQELPITTCLPVPKHGNPKAPLSFTAWRYLPQ